MKTGAWSCGVEVNDPDGLALPEDEVAGREVAMADDLAVLGEVSACGRIVEAPNQPCSCS